MNFNFSAPFFQFDPPEGCLVPRLNDYNLTTRTTVVGSFMVVLALVNITIQALLLATILYNWNYVFRYDFIYKLIINMNIYSIIYSLLTFAVIFPCIVFGCTTYSDTIMSVGTETWRGVEYGVYVIYFFIAIDRFFVFYFQWLGGYFRKVYTLVLIWVITFFTQNIMTVAGCPKMFDLVKFSPLPCRHCRFFGMSWNDTSRSIIYNLPYPMFILYALIFTKVLGMRCKVYRKQKFSKADQLLAFHFLILCGIQFALSNTENYLVSRELKDPSYWSLPRFSVPFDVHIINVVVLVATNRAIRKGMKNFLWWRQGLNSDFGSLDKSVHPSKSKWANRQQPTVLATTTI